MDLISVKIKKDNSVTKYIQIIRKFDSSLSMGMIKQNIENYDYVVSFDLEEFDVLEDLNGIDRKQAFRKMIQQLCEAGAELEIYQDEEVISIEFLDNLLETLDEE